MPKAVKVKNKKRLLYKSIVSTVENVKKPGWKARNCRRYLIGPLAFVNAACMEHRNTTTCKFKLLKKLEDYLQFSKGEQLFLDYRYGNLFCDECKKLKMIKK